MAFRRRRFSSGRRGFSRVAGPSDKRWVGYHDAISFANSNRDVSVPNVLESPPIFVPLVSVQDYGETTSGDPGSTIERQERIRLLRTIGRFTITCLDQPAVGQPSNIWAIDYWWYFAALNSDDTFTAELLDAASGFGTGTDTYSLSPAPPPGLWRQPISRFGSAAGFMNNSTLDGFGNVELSIARSFSRTWDFKPRARMQIPQQWFLVFGVSQFWLGASPAPPEASAFLATIMARTLITD